MLNKTPLFHQSLGPCVFLSFSLSLFLANSWARKPAELSFFPGLPRASQEGAPCLNPLERAPGAYVKQSKLCAGSFIGSLRKPGNISLFLFYFLTVDSGPPGSGPLKAQQ